MSDRVTIPARRWCEPGATVEGRPAIADLDGFTDPLQAAAIIARHVLEVADGE